MAKLGSSDIDVLPIALGANTFGWTADSETSHQILDAFVGGGGSLVDTADVYCHDQHDIHAHYRRLCPHSANVCSRLTSLIRLPIMPSRAAVPRSS